jgi:hypothetical protein
MANFSTAFGYKTLIMPVRSASVDTAFTGITGGVEGVGSTYFFASPTATDNLCSTAGIVTYGPSTGDPDVNTFDIDDSAADGDRTTPTTSSIEQSLDGQGDGAGSDFYYSLVGLTNAALETDTDSEEVITYDDTSLGFSQTIATGKSWSVSLAGVADFSDAAYQVMRLTEQNTVADSLRVKFGRIGPTGTNEAIYGYGTLTGYTESIEAGSIVSWEATIEGYGPYRLVTAT